jgi:putative inorganic carbon (hco3(-)) transporter
MALRDLLLLMIIGGLIPAIFYRPWIGILSWFWIGLMNPHRLTWGFMYSAPLAMWIGAVTLLALFFTKDRRSLPITREVILLILFAMYITMTTYYAWVPSAWGRWDTVIKIILMTLVTPLLIYGERRIVLLILVATFSIAFYGFKGGIFALTSGGQSMVLGPGRSFISGNTSLGLALVMVMPLILVSARMMTERWVDLGWKWLEPWYKPIGLAMYATMWLTGVAALFTYSRGALLGVLAIAPFMFLKMRRKLVLVLLLFATVTVVGFTFPDKLVSRWQTIETYEEDGSAMTRLQAWGVNWNVAMENPILGAGFDMAAMGNERWLSYANWIEPWASNARAAHSSYFQLLGHHGFGGTAIWLALVGFTFLTLNRVRRRARRETGQVWMAEYAWAIQVSLIGFLVAGAFLDMAYFNLLYAWIALAVIMRRELEEAPRVEVARKAVPVDVVPEAATNGPRFPDFVAPSAALSSPVEGGTGKGNR